MGAPAVIDWLSSKSHWLLSPNLTNLEKAATDEAAKRTRWIKSHIWIASSGTTRREGLRWVGLPKQAFLNAAESLNKHVGATKKDVWLNVLPTYHVSGLTMFARSYVASGRIVDLFGEKWNAKHMIDVANRELASFVSLVPTQLFDLVRGHHRAPKNLKAAFIGGGVLEEKLYAQAHTLGWPLLTCYGMTETCAQVATSRLEDIISPTKPKMKVLDHAIIEQRNGRLAIKSNSLTDFIVNLHPEKGFSLEDPLRSGWFVTEDVGEVENGWVTIAGRVNDQVKILGTLVSLLRIEEELKNFTDETFCVLAIRDARKGQSLIAVFEKPRQLRQLVKQVERYQKSSPSLWHFDHWYVVDQIPRSEMGKILKARLLAQLGLA